MAVDDPGSLSIRRTEDRVVIGVEGSNPASLRRTLDDLLACLGVAERTAGLVKRSSR
ncbi:MAG: hypothetical protein L3J95_04520 [Thermoplasmata archaeon]|nr:hypothetical protein [Thermoplasmata archaeon]